MGGGRIKQNENDKCQSYKETNLAFDMLCESVSSDMEVSASLMSTRKCTRGGQLFFVWCLMMTLVWRQKSDTPTRNWWENIKYFCGQGRTEGRWRTLRGLDWTYQSQNSFQIQNINEKQYISHSPHVKVPKKDNPLGVHMSDALNIYKYLVWAHKQQRGNYFRQLKKVINTTLRHLFYDHKFCDAWWKSKYSVAK